MSFFLYKKKVSTLQQKHEKLPSMPSCFSSQSSLNITDFEKFKYCRMQRFIVIKKLPLYPMQGQRYMAINTSSFLGQK